MDISFRTSKLAKLCNSTDRLRGEFGPRQGELIEQRLLELQGSETLADAGKLPSLRCHALVGNLSGLIAVDSVHPKRLIFRPDHDSAPRDDSGRLDWSQVTKIEIDRIDDYH